VIPNAYPFEPPRMVSFIARSLYFTNSRWHVYETVIYLLMSYSI
jgi:hypothetical protein